MVPQAIFTLLPLRVGVALLAVGRSLLAHAKASGGWSGGGESGGRAAGSEPAADRVQRWQVPLRGDQLFDLLVAAMSLGVVLFLWNLNAGTLYFWMKVSRQRQDGVAAVTGCFTTGKWGAG